MGQNVLLFMIDRKYLISLIAILVLAVLFVIAIAFSPDNKTNEENKEETCEEKCKGVESCLQQCADITANLATLNNDVSGCDRIQDLVKRDECIRNVGLKVALNTGDETQCQDENCRSAVLLSKAISTKDSSLCEQITIEAMKTDCLTLVS